MTNLKLKLPNPVERRLIVQFVSDSDLSIVLPDAVTDSGTGHIEVLKVGPQVTYCKPGDSILLFPDSPGGVVLNSDLKIALIHESNIMAVEDNSDEV